MYLAGLSLTQKHTWVSGIAESPPRPDVEELTQVSKVDDNSDHTDMEVEINKLWVTDDGHSQVAPAASEKCSSVHEEELFPAGSATQRFEMKNTQKWENS